jgi:hypothetical protein
VPLDFPNSPEIGTPYTINGRRYFWDGVKWLGSGGVTVAIGSFSPYPELLTQYYDLDMDENGTEPMSFEDATVFQTLLWTDLDNTFSTVEEDS